MNKFRRYLSLLLALCTLFCLVCTAFAAAPNNLTIAKLASGSQAVADTLESAIKAGTNNGGVYANVVVPKEVAVGTYTMGVEDYILMAAQAINDIAGGSSNTATVNYKNITLGSDIAQGASLSAVTKGQILDLARRIEKYGLALGNLTTSYNRPSDGTATYEGRICIYSIGSIFAKALASYAANGSLPASVTFTPSSYTTSETSAPQVPPTEPEPQYPVSDEYVKVIEAAVEVKEYVEEKGTLPASITINGHTCTMGEAEDLFLQVIVNINSGATTKALEYIDLADAGNPSESMSSGNIALTEYIDMANRNLNWNRANSASANYTTTSLGRMHYNERVYFNARVLAHYAEKIALPASLTTGSWYTTVANIIGTSGGAAAFGQDFSAHAAYLVPTANCQSTNSTIIAVAITGMNYSTGSHGGYKTPTNTYEAMFNLFEYLNAQTSYANYANTYRGALRTWNDKTGNCCDMAHLVIACARSLGVPGRYRHANCTFSSGLVTGHVWADVFCGTQFASKDKHNSDGWLTADMVSPNAYLGYKTNTTNWWDSLGNKKAELPF